MKFVILVLLCLVTVSPVQADMKWLLPSPLSMLLTLGSWVKKDRVEVFHVQVQGHGASEQAAREEAFRLAVNQAVGSLLLSHRHVANQEVIRNDIINYSSGHVHDFKLLDRRAQDGGIIVVMDVWVSRSLIADRLLNHSRDQASVEGGRITAQIHSLEQRHHNTQQVLESVLKDFPQRAFVLTVDRTRVQMGNDRSYWLTVPVHVRWAQTYLDSMAEAVRTVDPNPQCSGWFAQCHNKIRIAVAGTVAHFDDQGIYWLFSRHLFESRPMLRVSLRDTQGVLRFQQCFEVPEITQSSYAPWYFAEVGGHRATLYKGHNKTFNVQINLAQLPTSNLDRAEADVVRLSQCR